MIYHGRTVRSLRSPTQCLCLGVVFIAVGCGSHDAPADAGIEFDAQLPDAPPTVRTPAPPAPPVLPFLTPCPDGWRDVPPTGSQGVATCEPWPAGKPACPDGEAMFPGDGACVPLGHACPAGEWPEDLPTGAPVLYVRAAGAAGGDGSMTSPFGTAAEALAVATPGTVIALGKGTHAGPIMLGDGITLRGACAADTLVATPSTATGRASIVATGSSVSVADLQITGPFIGLRVESGGSLEARGVLVVGADAGALNATGGATLDARDVVTRDTNGVGIGILGGAHATIDRALVEGSLSFGVYVAGAGTDVALSDIAVSGTTGAESDAGIGLSDESHATIERAVLEGNEGSGLFLDGTPTDGPSVEATDLVVRGSIPAGGNESSGNGIGVYETGTADLHRVLLEGNTAAGLIVDGGTGGAVATLHAADLVVRDTRETTLGQEGAGITFAQNAEGQLDRILLTRNHAVGLGAGSGVTLVANDSVIEDTMENGGDPPLGIGVWAGLGGVVHLSRSRIERNHEAGLLATGPGSTVDLTDVDINRTQASADHYLGRGVSLQAGPVLTGSRVRIEHNLEVGLFAWGDGTMAQLTDFAVVDTRPRQCAATGCVDAAGGSGVFSGSGASVSLQTFRVTGSALAGLQVGTEGELSARHGEVSHNIVGANVQRAGFDLSRISDDVLYIDNGQALDARELPVPGPTTDLPP